LNCGIKEVFYYSYEMRKKMAIDCT